MLSPRLASIPSGSVQVRMPLGIPMKALVLIAFVAGAPFILLKTLWGVPACIPLWGFLRYHARREPLFLEIWAGQLSYTTYYHP